MSEMKQTIKKSSIKLFHRKGYFATSMRDIARASGIQMASIYYHYQNKEEILFDILRTTMLDLDMNLDRSIKGVKGAKEKLEKAIRAHIFFHVERQEEALISDNELRGLSIDNYKAIVGMRKEYEHKFQSIIKEGVEEGVFNTLDYKVASYGIVTMASEVDLWYNPNGRLSKRKIASIYSDLLLRGLLRKA